MKYIEKTVSKQEIYKGNIITFEKQTVELPNGKIATRDVILHPGAAVVIPISNSGEIYMVRQFRKPIDKELLELPAGKLDEGEDPLDCAIRELKEETGLVAENVQHLISIHSAPGFSNEVLHIYTATGLKEGDACADEDEFISTEKIPMDRLVEMIYNHEITDAKSIIGILMAERMQKNS